jgi:hypothetical protein
MLGVTARMSFRCTSSEALEDMVHPASPPLGHSSRHCHPGGWNHLVCDSGARCASSAVVDRVAVFVSVRGDNTEHIADAYADTHIGNAEPISFSNPSAVSNGNALDLDDSPCTADRCRHDVRRDDWKVVALQRGARGHFVSICQHVDSAGQLDVGRDGMGSATPRQLSFWTKFWRDGL